jgi:hypothetical protein
LGGGGELTAQTYYDSVQAHGKVEVHLPPKTPLMYAAMIIVPADVAEAHKDMMEDMRRYILSDGRSLHDLVKLVGSDEEGEREMKRFMLHRTDAFNIEPSFLTRQPESCANFVVELRQGLPHVLPYQIDPSVGALVTFRSDAFNDLRFGFCERDILIEGPITNETRPAKSAMRRGAYLYFTRGCDKNSRGFIAVQRVLESGVEERYEYAPSTQAICEGTSLEKLQKGHYQRFGGGGGSDGAAIGFVTTPHCVVRRWEGVSPFGRMRR